MDYPEALYADGFQPILVVCIKVQGSQLVRRAIISPEFLDILPDCPALVTAIRTAVEDVLELSKPPDDRKLRPGCQVENR